MKKFITLAVFFLACLCFSAQNKVFTLVIDAGHGGQDPGAIGKAGKEKDINLAVALKLGELVHKNYDDVNIVYTRKTDIFVTLQGRADIANNNRADLFVSIHTNSATSTSAYGTETYTLGLHRTESNLQVAMRENSVMLLEDDYKTKYQGFDPKSVDSYIMFQVMQDKYMDRSISFASDIQKEFRNHASRSDRGVRQAGLWVLHRSACPSVLVEVGFISNRAEESFLVSTEGQQKMAASIYNAFVKFKREHDKMSGKAASAAAPVVKNDNLPAGAILSEEDIQPVNEPIQKTETKTEQPVAADLQSVPDKSRASEGNKPVFKIQILAAGSKIKNGDSEFKGLKNVEYFFENRFYKYTVGEETDYQKIKELHRSIRIKFPDSFIIAFLGDKKLTEKEALRIVSGK